MPTDISFSTDDFGNAKIFTDNNAVSMDLLNLLTMPKNFDPLNPNKGVDIYSYIQNIDDPAKISEIKSEIFEQIQTYTPYQPSDIGILSKNSNIIIGIELQGSKDVFFFAGDGKRSSLDILKDS